MNFVDINEGGEKVILLIHPMLSSAGGMKFFHQDKIQSQIFLFLC